MMKSFSIKEALSAGWAGFKSQPWFLIKMHLVILVLTNVPQATIQHISSGWIAVPFVVAIQIFSLFLWIGGYKNYLIVFDGGKGKLEELFSGGPLFLSFLVGSIIFGVSQILGFLLLLIPGIVVSVTYGYYAFLIVDRRLGPLEALKASALLTKCVRWKLVGFGITILLFNLAGVLLLLVGVLVTIPVSILATVSVYRKLLSQTPSIPA